MTPREAIALAKGSILDIFADEGIRDVTLEEIRFDEDRNHWLVTIGFYRPVSAAAAQARRSILFSEPLTHPSMQKSFKTVRIDDETKSFKGVEHRAVEGADG